MDAAIEHGRKVCPSENMTSAIEEIFNHTGFPNPVKDVPEYICEFRRLWVGLMYAHVPVYFGSNAVAVILGFPGSILALITLSSKEFSTVSFMYHKAINLIELVHTFSILLSIMPWFLGDWMFGYLVIAVHHAYIKDRMERAIKVSLEAIIVWVSIERALLCNAPKLFEKVNRRGVALAIILSCILGAIIIMIPIAFTQTFEYNNETRLYKIKYLDYIDSPEYLLYLDLLAIFYYAELVLIIPSAVMTVLGLVQMSKRKKKLISAGGFQSATAKELLAHVAVNHQLCLLQICEVVGPALYSLLEAYGMSVNSAIGAPDRVDYTLQCRKPLKQVYRELLEFEIWMVVSMLTSAANSVVHSTHFYRYVIFSSKVRKAALRRFRRSPQVSSDG